MNQTPTCHLCGREVEPRDAWKEVAVYVSPRDAKGSIGSRDTGRLVCPACITRIRHKVSPAQEPLL